MKKILRKLVQVFQALRNKIRPPVKVEVISPIEPEPVVETAPVEEEPLAPGQVWLKEKQARYPEVRKLAESGFWSGQRRSYNTEQ